MDVWQGVLIIIGAAIAVLVAIGSAVAIIRSAALKETVALMTTANDELRKEVGDERDRRVEGERRCAKEIGHLEGQIQIWQGQAVATFLAKLSDGVIEVLDKTHDASVVKALDDVSDGIDEIVKKAISELSKPQQ